MRVYVNSAYNNCSVHLEDSGCTLTHIMHEVVQRYRWSQFRNNDYNLTLYMYDEVTGLLRDLCLHVYPGMSSSTYSLMKPVC